jgi:uncharacterized membrane protein YkvA (DUF1232 family)
MSAKSRTGGKELRGRNFPGKAPVYHGMRLLRLWYAAKTAIVRTVPLMRDTRVPVALKVAAIALALAVISPIDLFGDIPVLGAFDDAALLTLLCVWFVYVAGKHVEPVPVRQRTGTSLAVR